MSKYIMALDQGTTSSRCIIFDKNSTIISIAQKEFKQIYPKPGWVEHNPLEILESQVKTIKESLEKSNITISQIVSIGITNQRETIVVWNKTTGIPVYNAIVWQCRRTSEICDKLKKENFNIEIKNKTGLIVDAYFSATKIKWILDNIPGTREEAAKGNILAGTIDTWLIWNLTKNNIHITDYSNASRTMLYNIHTLSWDKDILNKLNIPENILPSVKSSSTLYGYTSSKHIDGEIPISGIAGDQQAALFGQTCFNKGDIKNTYGTGSFLLMNTKEKIYSSKNGLLSSIAWGINNKIDYVLEGSIFVTGAVVQWLRDELKIINNAQETEKYALSVPDTNDVYFVPSFVGLGAPHWDQYSRGIIIGLTRGAKKEHIIRAALESIAFQTYDVVKSLEEDSGFKIKNLSVDGGGSLNNFLMQFQSDILNIPINKVQTEETTALGAAYLAGLAVNFWSNLDEIRKNHSISKVFKPSMDSNHRTKLIAKWHKAIEKSKGWIEN